MRRTPPFFSPFSPDELASARAEAAYVRVASRDPEPVRAARRGPGSARNEAGHGGEDDGRTMARVIRVLARYPEAYQAVLEELRRAPSEG